MDLKGASLKPRTHNTQTRTKKEDKFSEDDEVDTAELRDSRRENKNKKLDDIEAEMRQRKHMWLVIGLRMTKCVVCILCIFVFFYFWSQVVYPY